VEEPDNRKLIAPAAMARLNRIIEEALTNS
jgi:hypothetical protein